MTNTTPEDDRDVEESFNDSLRDVQHMSLRLWIDGEFVAANSGGNVHSMKTKQDKEASLWFE